MITIKNGLVLLGSKMEPVRTNLSIKGQEIIEISPHASGGKQIDAQGCIVSPGLINSHIHLGDSVAKDVGDGKPLDEVVKPPHGLKHQILRGTDYDTLVDGVRDSLKQMIGSGTTSFIDFREGGVGGVEIIREALEDVPIRGICLGRQDSFLDTDINLKTLEINAHEILEISEGIGISGFGEISDRNAQLLVSICKSMQKIAAIHVAENEEVQETSLKSSGHTEIGRAIQAGFHLLIHATCPMGDDLELLSKADASLVACPRANGMLSTGIPPLLEMHQSGINLLLGTDNVMFNQPDMFREMEYALKVTRGFYKNYFSPKEIFKMATSNAGPVFDDRVGVLEEGYLADIMVVEQQSPDPILSLINRCQSKNIKTVITDGTIIFQR